MSETVSPPENGNPFSLCLSIRRLHDGEPGELLATTNEGKAAPPVLRTRESIQIEVSASRDGYVTVFNIDPGGHLSVLYPDPLDDEPPQLARAKEVVQVGEVELGLPVGRELVYAAWNPTAQVPGEFQMRELARRSKMPPNEMTTRSGTRSSTPTPTGDWVVVALELDHQA